MVRRMKTPTGRKSPVLFGKVKGGHPKTYPYVIEIRGRVAADNAFAAKKEVYWQVMSLAEQGGIPGAETVRVSYERVPRKQPGTQHEEG